MIKEFKKLSGYFIRYILVIALTFLCFAFPKPVEAKSSASTLRELRAELKELQAKKNSTNSQKNYTKKEINAKNIAINDAYAEIQKSKNQIEESKALIEVTDQKIAELEKKNEEIMVYYQIMQGENVYLEFITDSSSMTELIMRNDAISQLVSYQQAKLEEMEELIKENEQLQVDLIKKEDQLEQNIQSYESKLSELQNNLTELNEIGMDIDDEIKSHQELIKAYEQMGCGEDEDLIACSQVSGSAQWYKPFAKGRVNSIFGTRTDPFTGELKVHKAVDIGGNAEGTKVYAVANGVVVGMVDATGKYNSSKKTTCGGNQIYLQVSVAGESYIVGYAHLLQINVKVGDKVNVNTLIGLQGGGPKTKKWETCSTGTHLHLSVAKGIPKKGQSLSSYVAAYAMKPPGYPGKGGWFYSRTQFFS